MRSVGLWTKNEKQDEKLKVLQRLKKIALKIRRERKMLPASINDVSHA